MMYYDKLLEAIKYYVNQRPFSTAQEIRTEWEGTVLHVQIGKEKRFWALTDIVYYRGDGRFITVPLDTNTAVFFTEDAPEKFYRLVYTTLNQYIRNFYESVRTAVVKEHLDTHNYWVPSLYEHAADGTVHVVLKIHPADVENFFRDDYPYYEGRLQVWEAYVSHLIREQGIKS